MEEKEVMERTQFSYRKGKGTVKAIYLLTEIIEENIKKERKYVCFKVKETIKKNGYKRKRNCNGHGHGGRKCVKYEKERNEEMEKREKEG